MLTMQSRAVVSIRGLGSKTASLCLPATTHPLATGALRSHGTSQVREGDHRTRGGGLGAPFPDPPYLSPSYSLSGRRKDAGEELSKGKIGPGSPKAGQKGKVPAQFEPSSFIVEPVGN